MVGTEEAVAFVIGKDARETDKISRLGLDGLKAIVKIVGITGMVLEGIADLKGEAADGVHAGGN